MNTLKIPEGYRPVLNSYDLQRAIALTKDLFQQEFTQTLQLKRVSVPLFVRSTSGLNDDLSGRSGQLPLIFLPLAMMPRWCTLWQNGSVWR